MPTRTLNIIFAIVVVACLAGIFFSRSSRAEYEIRIGILASSDDEDYDGAVAFKDVVEKESAGRIDVRIFTSGQYCGGERECIENLQSGVLDIFMTTFGGFGNFFGAGQVFDLPYILPDDRVAECVLDGPLVDEFRDAVLDAGLGVRLMTVGNTGGWRDFATTDKPIVTPKDLKGVKIRTTPSPLEQSFVRELGANPTPIAWSEIYLALATGVVDGTKNSVQDIISMKLDENVKYMTIDHHAYMGAIWWYSNKRWNELPDDLRAVIDRGFVALQLTTREIPKRRQAEAYAAFEASGGKLLRPDDGQKSAFVSAAGGMRDWYVKAYGRDWLDRLDSAVADCERSAI